MGNCGLMDLDARPAESASTVAGRPLRVLLADPPALEDDYDKAYPNLGLLQLISYLRQETPLPDDDILFLDQLHGLDDHLRLIAEQRPALYGISFSFLTQRVAYRTINAVKRRFPELPVIAGGPHPTAAPEEVMQQTAADLVCIGEGEQTLADVVRELLAGGRDFTGIPGLLVRRGDQVVRTARPRVLEDLDALPPLAWDRVDFGRYTGQHYCRSQPQSCIVVSRGCPHQCTFCSLPVWRAAKPYVRLRRPDGIAREVDWLYRLGVREIKMVSDEINVTLPWAKEVCRAIIALGHRDLYFQCNLRADKVDDELAALFARMNMWLVHLGVESANDRVLAGIRKRVTVTQIEECLRLLKKHGVRVLLFMMAFQLWEEDGRLEWERPAEVRHSLAWSWRQFLRGRIAYMTWSITTPMPGAPLYDILERHGLRTAAQVLENWDRNKDYLGVELSSLGISGRTKQRLLRAGILSKGVFALRSGHFDWRRNFYRFGILLRSFRGRRVRRPRQQASKGAQDARRRENASTQLVLLPREPCWRSTAPGPDAGC